MAIGFFFYNNHNPLIVHTIAILAAQPPEKQGSTLKLTRFGHPSIPPAPAID